MKKKQNQGGLPPYSARPKHTGYTNDGKAYRSKRTDEYIQPVKFTPGNKYIVVAGIHGDGSASLQFIPQSLDFFLKNNHSTESQVLGEVIFEENALTFSKEIKRIVFNEGE